MSETIPPPRLTGCGYALQPIDLFRLKGGRLQRAHFYRVAGLLDNGVERGHTVIRWIYQAVPTVAEDASDEE